MDKDEKYVTVTKTETKTSSFDTEVENGQNTSTSSDKGFFANFCDSFKPYELSNEEKSHIASLAQDSGLNYEEELVKYKVSHSPLSRSLKSRHLQMIAIGGAIGSGLFVGSGSALHYGGPAALVIAFLLIGIMLYATVQALGELAILYPISGSFAVLGSRFIDPAWGFSMGWNYAIQWTTVLPLELVAAALTIQYWNTTVNPAVWTAIFWIVIVFINLFGVKGYGEAEFTFSFIKVVAVIGYIIFAIIVICGGGPNGHYYGSKYYDDPGAFANGFKGVCSVFVLAAFSFVGTELTGLASAETANPRKALPRAIKQVFWRITIFYVVTLTLIGLLVRYDDPRLIGTSHVDARASPFVISIKEAGVSGLPSVINAVILISVLSVGNSAVFGASRTLLALAQQNMAPSFFGYIDRSGRPIFGVIFVLAVGLLGFLSASGKSNEVFSWLMAITGLSSIFTWGSICLIHILFRIAWKKQGHTLDEIPYRAQTGIYGSFFGLIFNFLVLMAQFWTGLFPQGSKSADVKSFFNAYLALPIILLSYFGYKIIRKTSFVKTSEVDLISGRREIDLDALKEELRIEREELSRKNIFVRIYYFWC